MQRGRTEPQPLPKGSSAVLCRRQDNRLYTPRDHLLDDGDLAGHVLFVLDAAGDELVRLRMRCLVPLRALLHRLEELVGERLHDERDHRARRRCRTAARGGREQGERERDESNQATH